MRDGRKRGNERISVFQNGRGRKSWDEWDVGARVRMTEYERKSFSRLRSRGGENKKKRENMQAGVPS